VDVIERMDDGTMVLVWRIHHCLADGTASVRLGSAVLWSDAPDEVSPPASSWTLDPGPGALALLARGLTRAGPTRRTDISRPARRVRPERRVRDGAARGMQPRWQGDRRGRDAQRRGARTRRGWRARLGRARRWTDRGDPRQGR
jgi:hypothetical protein